MPKELEVYHMSIKFILRFAFCVLHYFRARPHDSRKDQFWTPVTIKQQHNAQNVHYIAVLPLQDSKIGPSCCHEAWPKITQNRKRRTQNAKQT